MSDHTIDMLVSSLIAGLVAGVFWFSVFCVYFAISNGISRRKDSVPPS
jgi:hypothetical protein